MTSSGFPSSVFAPVKPMAAPLVRVLPGELEVDGVPTIAKIRSVESSRMKSGDLTLQISTRQVL
jgi:hypothetical protein